MLVFFGFVRLCSTFYVMSHYVAGSSIIAAIACGLAVDTLLMVNNYRDRVEDRANGKRTIVVRFGENIGAKLYLWLGILAVGFSILLFAYGYVFGALLPICYLPFHIIVWRNMVKINQGKELNSILGLTSRNIIIFSLLLIAGILLDSLFLK